METCLRKRCILPSEWTVTLDSLQTNIQLNDYDVLISMVHAKERRFFLLLEPKSSTEGRYLYIDGRFGQQSFKCQEHEGMVEEWIPTFDTDEPLTRCLIQALFQLPCPVVEENHHKKVITLKPKGMPSALILTKPPANETFVLYMETGGVYRKSKRFKSVDKDTAWKSSVEHYKTFALAQVNIGHRQVTLYLSNGGEWTFPLTRFPLPETFREVDGNIEL